MAAPIFILGAPPIWDCNPILHFWSSFKEVRKPMGCIMAPRENPMFPWRYMDWSNDNWPVGRVVGIPYSCPPDSWQPNWSYRLFWIGDTPYFCCPMRIPP